MRFFFGGPRVMGLRTGISLGPEDFRVRLGSGQQSGDTGGFVYVIRGEHGLVKVGVSTNPSARMAQLRTASPFPLTFAYVAAVEGRAGNAYLVEQAAHGLLARHAMAGEWFDVPIDMAVAAIAAGAHKTGLKIVEIAALQVDAVVQAARATGAAPEPTPWLALALVWFVKLVVLAALAALGVLIVWAVIILRSS